MNEYLTSPCCNSDIRAEVDQTCKVSIDEQGWIDDCTDFTDPAVNRETFCCGACGNFLEIEYRAGKPAAVKVVPPLDALDALAEKA